MSIQYSGTNINNTFVNTVGTRLEIVTGLSTALVAAGWNVISGGGTGNQLLESATTPSPQNLVCRIQLYDPGSGNCAQIKFRNQAGTATQANFHPLYAQASKTWRVIANPYQFFIFSTASTSVGREFVGGGVPYLPSFLQGVITEGIWSMGNGRNDIDSFNSTTFRNNLVTSTPSSQPNLWMDVNLNVWENFNNYVTNAYTGWPQLIGQQGAQWTQVAGTNLYATYKWHDDSLMVYEPLIAWGASGYTDESKIRGQLWDAAIVSDAFGADQTTSFDTRNWWVLTNGNYGTSGLFARGSLLVVIP
jgi:hypothetical protein